MRGFQFLKFYSLLYKNFCYYFFLLFLVLLKIFNPKMFLLIQRHLSAMIISEVTDLFIPSVNAASPEGKLLILIRATGQNYQNRVLSSDNCPNFELIGPFKVPKNRVQSLR